MYRVVVLSRAGEQTLDQQDRHLIATMSRLRFVRRERPPALDDALFARCPRLRRIVLYATGHDHVDSALLARHGVELTTLPCYATIAVAEHALAMTLALSARIPLAHDRSRGLVPGSTSLRGIELAGRTLGVVGTGLIGRRLARLAAGHRRPPMPGRHRRRRRGHPRRSPSGLCGRRRGPRPGRGRRPARRRPSDPDRALRLVARRGAEPGPADAGRGSADRTRRADPGRGRLMSRVARRVRRGLIAVAAVVAVLAPTTLALAAGSRWWRYIAAEQTPMTWLQSVVLVLAGAAALLLALMHALRREPGTRAWVLLGCGFVLLALDERFAVHERVRDGFLAPRGVRVPLLPWVGPGDFLLLGLALLGLVLLPRVLSALRPDRTAWWLFGTGVALSLLAVGSDSVDPARLALTAQRWEQTLEECVELAAGLCFLVALAVRSVALLDSGSGDAGSGDAGSGTPVHGSATCGRSQSRGRVRIGGRGSGTTHQRPSNGGDPAIARSIRRLPCPRITGTWSAVQRPGVPVYAANSSSSFHCGAGRPSTTGTQTSSARSWVSTR